MESIKLSRIIDLFAKTFSEVFGVIEGTAYVIVRLLVDSVLHEIVTTSFLVVHHSRWVTAWCKVVDRLLIFST